MSLEDRELPAVMVDYFAARAVMVSGHVNGHRGQQFKAQAKRRGTWAKIVRRRHNTVRRAQVTARSLNAQPARGAPATVIIFDEISSS